MELESAITLLGALAQDSRLQVLPWGPSRTRNVRAELVAVIHAHAKRAGAMVI